MRGVRRSKGQGKVNLSKKLLVEGLLMQGYLLEEIKEMSEQEMALVYSSPEEASQFNVEAVNKEKMDVIRTHSGKKGPFWRERF